MTANQTPPKGVPTTPTPADIEQTERWLVGLLEVPKPQGEVYALAYRSGVPRAAIKPRRRSPFGRFPPHKSSFARTTASGSPIASRRSSRQGS